MAQLKYTKDDGTESERNVEPIGFIFDDRDKVMCLDLSQYEGVELESMKVVAKEMHREFLKNLYASPLAGNIRTFFLDGISEVKL